MVYCDMENSMVLLEQNFIELDFLGVGTQPPKQ